MRILGGGGLRTLAGTAPPPRAEGQAMHVQGQEFPGCETEDLDKWCQVLVLRCEYLMMFKGGPPGVGYWCMEKGEDGNSPDSAEFQLRKPRFIALWRESQAYLQSLKMFDDDGESYNSDAWEVQDDAQEAEDAGTEETAPDSKPKPLVYEYLSKAIARAHICPPTCMG